MQLLLIAALMLLGNKSETMEMLKYIAAGNGEFENILKQAEEAAEIINTFMPKAVATPKAPPSEIPLKPIANIADRSIYTALSGAMA